MSDLKFISLVIVGVCFLTFIISVPFVVISNDKVDGARALCEANGGVLLRSTRRPIFIEGSTNTYKFPCIDRNAIIKY